MQNYKKTIHPQNKLTFFCFAEVRQPSRKIHKKMELLTRLSVFAPEQQGKKLSTPSNKKAGYHRKNILIRPQKIIFKP